MELKGSESDKSKVTYEPPAVLASYDKEELEAALKPHAQGDTNGSGCGCGCG